MNSGQIECEKELNTIAEGIRFPSMAFFPSTELGIFCLSIILVYFYLYIGEKGIEGEKLLLLSNV